MLAFCKKKGFTLIELLVALGVVATLSTAIIVALNPAELLKQSRDSTRISDLNTINTALNAFVTDNPTGTYGSASTTYVSLVDSSATCDNLGLPALTDGSSYHCATSTAALKRVDGTGWIPVDFTQISFGSPLSELPIDPVNATSGGLYYTYNTPGTSWEMEVTSILESQKYSSSMTTDGGVSDLAYEIGSNFNLLPANVLNRSSSTYGQGNNPAPTLSSISPTSTPVGGSGFTLTVNGTNFVSSSVVNWDGSSRSTTYSSASLLTASILTADVAATGTFPVTVTNPAPGGGTSDAINVAVQTFGPSGAWTTDSTSSLAQGYGNSLAEADGDLYVLIGNSTSFKKYSTSNRTWTTLASTSAAVTFGAALVRVTSDAIYAFRGNSTTFWKYTISSNTWTSMASTSAATGNGASLAYPGSGDFIYAARGGGTTDFWQYSISNDSWGISGNAQGVGNSIVEVSGKFYVFSGNGTVFQKFDPSTYSWTALASAPAAVSSGAGLVKADNDTIYAFRGGDVTTFWKYTISSDAWASMTSSTSAIGYGGALAYPGSGDYIYALAGKDSTTFMKYSISGNSWASGSSTPAAVSAGGSLVAFSTSTLYALRGLTTTFWEHNIATGAWTAKAVLPATVAAGASLTTDGVFVYATRGNGSKTAYKYNPSTNAWTTLTDSPVAFGSGTFNALGGIAYSSSLGVIYAVTGQGTATANEILKYDIASDGWPTITSSPLSVGIGHGLTALNTSSLYAFRGSSAIFWHYNISTGAWTTKTSLPIQVSDGSALANDGATIYTARGNGTTEFYSYSPSTNAWTAQVSTPGGMGSGVGGSKGDLVYSSTAGALFATPGTNTSVYKLLITGQ